MQAAPHELPNGKDGSQKENIEFMRSFGANQKQQHVVVIINAATVRKTEALIQACEHCNEEDVQFPFAVILDRVTGSDPSVTDYVLEVPAKCPNCRRDPLEKTLIEPV